MIQKMLLFLTKISKEESDFLEHVLRWDIEKQQAFLEAKKILEKDAA